MLLKFKLRLDIDLMNHQWIVAQLYNKTALFNVTMRLPSGSISWQFLIYSQITYSNVKISFSILPTPFSSTIDVFNMSETWWHDAAWSVRCFALHGVGTETSLHNINNVPLFLVVFMTVRTINSYQWWLRCVILCIINYVRVVFSKFCGFFRQGDGHKSLTRYFGFWLCLE